MTVHSELASQPVRRSGGRRHSRRADILQAAIDLFAKGGSRGTCIAAIADRIGVTPAAVMHHFKTKEALLGEVVAEIDNRRPSFGEQLPSLERLRHTAEWGRLVEENEELANLARLAAVMVAEALDADHPSHEYFVERHRKFRSDAADLLRTGIGEGWIRPDIDPAVVSTLIVGIVHGVQVQWFLDPQSVPMTASLEFMFDMLASALASLGRPRPLSSPRQDGKDREA